MYLRLKEVKEVREDAPPQSPHPKTRVPFTISEDRTSITFASAKAEAIHLTLVSDPSEDPEVLVGQVSERVASSFAKRRNVTCVAYGQRLSGKSALLDRVVPSVLSKMRPAFLHAEALAAEAAADK
eukprot:RCo047268